jgi:hypothetical protein
VFGPGSSTIHLRRGQGWRSSAVAVEKAGKTGHHA